MSSSLLADNGDTGDRPALSAPDVLSPAALADARRAQPRRGLAGLVFVLPVAALIAAGAGGPAHSMAVLAPLTTFALPVVAMIAFWWEDWPGSSLRGGWSGLSDTAIVVLSGVVLTLAGRRLIGHGPGYPPAFPETLPLAAGIFTVMLQLTLVTEGWPLRRPERGRRRWPGVVALALCWVAGAVMYLLLVRSARVPGEVYGAWLATAGLWQMLWYVALRGWPFARIRRRGLRLAAGNCAVLACAVVTYVAARHGFDVEPATIGAAAGCGIAAVLVVTMLFEAWPAIRLPAAAGRSLAVAFALVLAILLYSVLATIARAAGLMSANVDGWVTHATLNALALAVILHVAVWRRWPLTG